MDDQNQEEQNQEDQQELVAFDEGWMTLEIRRALARITSGEVGKRRESTIRLAFAKAMGQKLEPVFELPGVVNQSIWYMNILPLVTVRRAFDLCVARVLEWRTERVALEELRCADELRVEIATGGVVAVQGLKLTAMRVDDPAPARTKASEALLRLVDPGLVNRDGEQAAFPVQVTNLGDLLGEVEDGEFGSIRAALQGEAVVAGEGAGSGEAG